MKKVLFIIIVLAALFLAAEVGVTYLSQRGMEKAMYRQYQLPSSLEVSINSFPFIISLVRNNLRELRLGWGDNIAVISDAEEIDTAYSARVELYDVELGMTSLLAGRLELKRVSRIEAYISIEGADLDAALGLLPGSLNMVGGDIFLYQNGEKIDYEVEALGDNRIVFKPVPASTVYTGSDSYPRPELNDSSVELHLAEIPFGAKVKSARVEGASLTLSIDIPMWRGYITRP